MKLPVVTVRRAARTPMSRHAGCKSETATVTLALHFSPVYLAIRREICSNWEELGGFIQHRSLVILPSKFEPSAISQIALGRRPAVVWSQETPWNSRRYPDYHPSFQRKDASLFHAGSYISLPLLPSFFFLKMWKQMWICAKWNESLGDLLGFFLFYSGVHSRK